MKNDADSFWFRVDSLWKQTGETKQEFCKRTNGEINFYTWSNKKSQHKMPNLELAGAFAKYLNVSIDYLYNGETLADPVLKAIDSNSAVKEIARKLTMCDESNLAIVNAMVNSWVPVESRSKGLA